MRALVLLLALTLLPAVALAHGGRPQTYDVLFGPSDQDIVVPGTFGVMATLDGGAHWDWLCIEAMPDARRGQLRPATRTPDDRILFAQSFGVLAGRDRGCDPVYDTTLHDRFVADVSARPGGGFVAVTSDAAMENHLFVSSTGADPFVAFGDPFPAGVLAERVRVAPSDPMRVYVSGQAPVAGTAAFTGHLLVSRDGGAHFTALDVPLGPDEHVLRLLAVDPADPDHFFMVAMATNTDRLIEARTAGTTLGDVTMLDAVSVALDRPFGLAFGSDGSVWFGNTLSGLFVLDATGITVVDKFLNVACVVARGDEMYLCADGLDDPFALGVQHVTGPYAPRAVMTFPQIASQRACGTALDGTCAMWWNDLLIDTGRIDQIPDAGIDGGLATDAGSVDAGAVDAAFDAGAPSTPSRGCGCSVGASPPRGAFLLALAVLVSARARRASRLSS
jgi:MYXO-CTERM domain-containing protein